MKLERIRVLCLLLAGLLGSCVVQPRPVPLTEAKVKTAAEARQLVLAGLKADSVQSANLRFDAVEVEERPAEWHVYIPCRTRNLKPCGASYTVDKRTAVVRVLLLL